MHIFFIYTLSFAFSLHFISLFFFFNDTATTEIYTLSLHDALPIYHAARCALDSDCQAGVPARHHAALSIGQHKSRSEEHTSELQSRRDLVCRLLLEKKKKKNTKIKQK